jgi:hypothetical protein
MMIVRAIEHLVRAAQHKYWADSMRAHFSPNGSQHDATTKTTTAASDATDRDDVMVVAVRRPVVPRAKWVQVDYMVETESGSVPCAMKPHHAAARVFVTEMPHGSPFSELYRRIEDEIRAYARRAWLDERPLDDRHQQQPAVLLRELRDRNTTAPYPNAPARVYMDNFRVRRNMQLTANVRISWPPKGQHQHTPIPPSHSNSKA